MRVLAFAFVLLGLPAMAVATPVHRLEGFDASLVRQDEPRLVMPTELGYGSAAATRAHNDLIFGLRGTDDMPVAPGLHFGPVHAESEIINGRRRIHYRVDGFTVMGGEVGGLVSHRGAMLTLHWGD